MPKDVSIRIAGRDREHIEAIQKDWPVKQADVIGAALDRFRRLPADEQAEAFRARASRRRRAEPAPA